MNSNWQKLKLYLAIICIGSMAFLTGVPIVPKEKVERMLQVHDRDTAAEVIKASEEQS